MDSSSSGCHCDRPGTIVKPSTVTNREGAKVSPCRTPALTSNSPDISPSTRTDDLVPQYRTEISLQTSSGNP